MLALLTLTALVTLADAPPPPDAVPGPQSSGDRRVGPFTRDTYPSEVSARPLTLPAGMIRASAALDADWIQLGTYAWFTRLGLAGSYGLTDRIELGASALFGLSPLLDAEGVAISGALLVYDGQDLDLALTAGLSAVPSFAGTEPTLTLGLPGRLLFADRLFLTFGAELLTLQLAPFLPQAALQLGVGAQITSSLAVVLQTDALKLLSQAAFSRTFVFPLDLSVTLAVAPGFDLRARVLTFNVAEPRLAGTLTLAGSAYF